MFIDLLNKVRLDNTDDTKKLLSGQVYTHESDENYLKDPLHMYVENKLALKRNEVVLNDLPGGLYTVEVNEKIPDNYKYPLATMKEPKQTDTGGLAKLLKLKIGAKVMLKVNSDMQDRPIISQMANNSYIEFAQGSVRKVYVKFSDEQAGLKAIRSSHLGRQNCWVPIEK